MKVKLTLSVIMLLAIFVACSSPNPESENTVAPSGSDSQLVTYGVAGYITEHILKEDGTVVILVEGELGNNGADYHRGYVEVNEDTVIYGDEEVTISALKEGQYVNVFFSGDVMESDPIQATARQINIIPES